MGSGYRGPAYYWKRMIIFILVISLSWIAYLQLTKQQVQTVNKMVESENAAVQPAAAQETGQEIDFKVGDTVNGREIRLSSGLVLQWKAIRNSTYSGKVIDGHIYPKDVTDDVLLGVNNGFYTYQMIDNEVLNIISVLPNGPGMAFKQGDTVSGTVIVIDNSNAVYKESAIRNSSVEGTVYSGAKWLKGITERDIVSQKLKLVNPATDKPDDFYDGRKAYDTISTPNHTVDFKAGDTVYGYEVKTNGKTFFWTGIENSPYEGTVSYGRVFPKYSGVWWLKNLNIDLRIVNPRIDQPWSRKEASVCLNNDEVLKELPFKPGDTVLGNLTFLLPDGSKYFDNALILNSPYGGIVKADDGVIALLNPTQEKIKEILVKGNGVQYPVMPTLLDPKTL